MHNGKKRCIVCVDKIMEKLSKSVVTEDKYIHILLDNKSGDIIDISEDNEKVDDVETDFVSDVIINEVTGEITDENFLDKNNEVLKNEVHMNKCGVEEKVKDNGVIIEKLLQDKMSDHYLDHYHNKDIIFLSNYIKFISKSWKGKCSFLLDELKYFVNSVTVSLTSIYGRKNILMFVCIQNIQNLTIKLENRL